VLAADTRAVNILRLLARRRGAGRLDARDEEVEAAHVARKHWQFHAGFLGHGVEHLGLLCFEQSGFGGDIHGFSNLAYVNLRIDLHRGLRPDADVFLYESVESRRFDAHFVNARDPVYLAIIARHVRGRRKTDTLTSVG